MGGLNTQANIGIRRMIYSLNPPAYRCFEDDGVTQYRVSRVTLDFMGVSYNQGDLLPYDAGSVYSLAAIAQLRLFWNQQWIDSAS